MSKEVPFHRTIYRYSDADWDSFRSFVADMPREYIFSHHPTKVASLVSDWVSEGIDTFIPHKKYQQKPLSQPWFTPGCAAAIAHRNHYFRLYNANRCPETRAAFRQSSNRCSRILREAKESYKSAVKQKVEEETLGSKEFWKITNKILNRGKSSIPVLINGPEILPSAVDKSSLFGKLFSQNSNLDDSNIPLPNFPLRTASSLHNVKVIAQDVNFHISNLSSSKATGPDNIPVIVLKNIAPELSPVLAKVFNVCLKRRIFRRSGKSLQFVQFLKTKAIDLILLTTDP